MDDGVDCGWYEDASGVYHRFVATPQWQRVALASALRAAREGPVRVEG